MGHRQELTVLRVLDVTGKPGATKKAAAKKPAAAKAEAAPADDASSETQE
jgi:hypothetical protein